MAFTSYAPTGPWTDNVTPPGLSAQYNNNIETFLQQIVAPVVADSHVSSDGSGHMTALSVQFTHGKITRIAFGFQAVVPAGTTITHNLGASPSLILLTPSNAGVTAYADTGASSTTFVAHVSTNNNIWWLCIA